MRRISVVAVLVSACAVAPSVEPASATIVDVIDGDSIVMATASERIELRLQGINAPERSECLGPEAARALGGLASGENITFEVAGTDQFGRSLGDVFVSGRSVSEAMVATGMALALSDEGRSALHAAQNAARSAGLGIWAADVCGAIGPRPEVDLVELIANPPGPDDEALEAETVTIVNSGDETVSLAGWILRDESSANRFAFGSDISLAPGDSVVVSSGCGEEPGIIYWCSQTPVWNNGGDTALLLDDRGRIVSVMRHEP